MPPTAPRTMHPNQDFYSYSHGPTGAQPPHVPTPAPCEGAQILARVGADVVLACEVTATVNEILSKNKDRIPPEQLDLQRKLATKELLKQWVQFKLIYQDAQRAIPEENLQRIRERISEHFDKVVVPARMEEAGVASRRDLEQQLRQLGTSLDRQRRAFVERTLAQQWAREQIKSDEEVSHEEMLNYYREHLDDYRQTARARWQQLTLRKSSYPSETEAFAALAELGNQILNGASFEEIAKAHSEGVTAADGGLRDWTSKGTLVSEVLDEAIFGLPVGRLSRILEDDTGFHIIRVLQREEATVTPFLEAQVGIKQQIIESRRKEQLRQYLARLEEQIPVSTVFDQEDSVEQASAGSRSWIQ